VSGGQAEDAGISMNVLRFLQIYPDAHRIVFESFDPGSRELWVLENFLPKATKALAPR